MGCASSHDMPAEPKTAGDVAESDIWRDAALPEGMPAEKDDAVRLIAHASLPSLPRSACGTKLPALQLLDVRRLKTGVPNSSANLLPGTVTSSSVLTFNDMVLF